MKRNFLIAVFLIAAILVSFGHSLDQKTFKFNGAWLPAIPDVDVGPENYTELENMEYTDTGMRGVRGYSKINTTAISGNTASVNGHHFKKDGESHVIVKTYDGSNYELKQNTTAIPSQGDFSGTDLYTVSSGIGSMVTGPEGVFAYADDDYSLVWTGDELKANAFLVSPNTDGTDSLDYTEAVSNDLDDGANVAVVGGSGNDSYTKLLLHLDGTDGASTTTDSSPSAHTVTMTNAVLDTDQSKFGASACYFDGTGDYLSVPDHADFSLGSNDLTIDLWVRWNSVPSSSQSLYSHYDDSDNYVQFLWSSSVTGLYFVVKSGGSYPVQVQGASWTPSADTWYHLAVSRSGDDFRLFIDGTQTGTTETDSSAILDVNGSLFIGSQDGSASFLEGWIDEPRVSNGVARWTADFNVPVKAFSPSSRNVFIGSPYKLNQIKFYVKDPNTVTSTMTGAVWNGGSLTSLVITDNTDTGASLAQTGTVTFTTPADAEKRYLEGGVFYWYRFSIDDGDATIYKCTVSGPMQPVSDVWNGANRTCIAFQVYKDSVYSDFTSQVANPQAIEGAEYTADIGGMGTDSEWFIAVFDDRMTAFDVTMFPGKVNAVVATAQVYYWNGHSYVSAGAVSDGTLDEADEDTTFSQSGVISWQPPAATEEFKKEAFGVNGYSYKVVVSSATTADTAIDAFYGIPAPLDVKGHPRVSEYKGRLLLFDGNRVDYSQTDAPWVFNGIDSSDSKRQSLYFGGKDDLVCGTSIFNRYGSSLIESWVGCKQTETYLLTGSQPDSTVAEPFVIRKVSPNIGCPAPMTMKSVEVGFEVEDGLKRNAVVWLDSTGPVLFDGAVIAPIGGIDNYFDRSQTECINYTYIENATAFIGDDDSYHLLIPSGESTSLNKWFRLDLEKMKWSEIVPTTYPQITFNVSATTGAKYAYGMSDAGTMYRLENGSTWDGTAIAHTITTGEFFPAGFWSFSEIKKVKFAAKAISEDQDVTITQYAGGSAVGPPGIPLTLPYTLQSEATFQLTVALDASGSIARNTAGNKTMGNQGYTHKLSFECSTSSGVFEPLAWGYEAIHIRED